MPGRIATGFIYSFSFLGIVILTARILTKFDRIPPEIIRKFIHISVSNWWFISSNYFYELWAALTGPILFIILNSIATFFDLARYLGMNDRTRNYGLIYFPISLVILIIMEHSGFITKYMNGMAILVMGYGDGFAAIIGKKYGVSKIHGKKTYLGSLTMLITSFIVLSLFSYFYDLGLTNSSSGILTMVITSIVATVNEIFTPFGLDNLSVPIGTAITLRYLTQNSDSFYN
ncbi:dolichol kinase [Tritrichomonas foetus]|uniref:Dolichol kinase n=1 Tax=Tritrichomonas foetus TaxID=1144522 RepID=A0A1J4KJB2_9EUKA|nr:dolichol kinase [Tritrichomonas foetus]|eukprot:OHT09908.1 dolichol kinase [Tritrichomonas foetus]